MYELYTNKDANFDIKSQISNSNFQHISLFFWDDNINAFYE